MDSNTRPTNLTRILKYDTYLCLCAKLVHATPRFNYIAMCDMVFYKNHRRCENENRVSKKSFIYDKALQQHWVGAIIHIIWLKYFNKLF